MILSVHSLYDSSVHQKSLQEERATRPGRKEQEIRYGEKHEHDERARNNKDARPRAARARAPVRAQEKDREKRPVMKTSRRRASAIITGSQSCTLPKSQTLHAVHVHEPRQASSAAAHGWSIAHFSLSLSMSLCSAVVTPTHDHGSFCASEP